LKGFLIFLFFTSNTTSSNVHGYNDRDGIFKERFCVNNIISVCQIELGTIVKIFNDYIQEFCLICVCMQTVSFILYGGQVMRGEK
jgi:hypothetical protein